MKKMKRTSIAVVVALAAAVSATAQAVDSNASDKQSAIDIKPDPSLVEYQKRLAKIEREMELMRQQNALLQAKISRIQAQRQYEQVVSGSLPGVLTVFKSGGKIKARIRYQTGIERVVSVGDPLNKRAVVVAIDEKSGVIAKVGRKKIVLDYVSRNNTQNGASAEISLAGAPATSDSPSLPVAGSPLPPPSMGAPFPIR